MQMQSSVRMVQPCAEELGRRFAIVDRSRLGTTKRDS